MSQAALGRTITQLQRAVQARIANEQAFKARIYNELNTILARLRHCAVAAAAAAIAPPGPASAAALVDLNREIGLIQTEVGNLENNLLDENDATDVLSTVRREAPNIRYDTQANMQRFARAPPPYVYPGPGRAPAPLLPVAPAPSAGLLGSLGLGGVFGSSSGAATGRVGSVDGSAEDGSVDPARGERRLPRVAPVGDLWTDDDDLDAEGYPAGSGPGGPGGSGPSLGPGGSGGPGIFPFTGPPPPYPGLNGSSSGGWTPKRKTPKRKPKKKSVRR